MFIPYHTRNFDDTAARIKKLIAVLEKYWFQDKKREFEKLCDPGEDYYIVEHTPDEIEAVSFDKYCFYGSYSGNQVCGEGVMNKIVATVKEIATDAGIIYDYDSIKSLIADVKKWIDQEVNENIEFANNEKYATVIKGIVRKINWKIDYSFNNKLKALELRHSYKNPTNPIAPNQVLTDSFFDAGILNEIFYKHAIEPFIKIENQLIVDEWFTERKWNEEKNILVSLILILQGRGYLKPIKGKSKRGCVLVYRRFFERRYGIELNKQMQPSQIKRFQLPKSHEPTFSFIPSHLGGK